VIFPEVQEVLEHMNRHIERGEKDGNPAEEICKSAVKALKRMESK
jgi:hypothetical protein